MTRVHLVLLWHMHQPQYRDPVTGRCVLPWTRLHALKDYWGMVKLLEEFPDVHATFNLVPSLVRQLEEYASGNFQEPWFDLAFAPISDLDEAGRREILLRGFQINREHLMARWPRYIELFDRTQAEGIEDVVQAFGPRDWCDLQVLSQLAWMDEFDFQQDALVRELAHKGANFTAEDKAALRARHLQSLRRVLPEYRRAADRGQVELSTTPFYHPILPLVCDTDVARAANPHSPLPEPAFRCPEDAREQLVRARQLHQRVFGRAPVGLWPSEGSVSDQALEIAAELGFRWFASDEGILGRTLNVGFPRNAAGVPASAERLYTPLRAGIGSSEMVGLFRDHYLSDLVGFVYSRLEAAAAAEDLHRRLRTIGEQVRADRPLTVAVVLDGENAWEHFAHNGRPFLREFYGRIQADRDIRALTVSEAIAEAGKIASVEHIAPGSWINANFDIWIGHAEDVQAWNLLRDARHFYAQAASSAGQPGRASAAAMDLAYEALLAAEGSDWCWWYGPEHSTANDAEFDALYRAHLTQVYRALGAEAPEALAVPIKARPEPAIVVPPTARLRICVDGRETSYFEWLGAGLYAAQRRSEAMHGRAYFLHELHYGFDEQNLFLRADPFPEMAAQLGACELRVTLRGIEELRVIARFAPQQPAEVIVERANACLLGVEEQVQAAFDKIFEIRVSRSLLATDPAHSLRVSVVLWQAGLPMDLLPAEGTLNIALGAEFAWAGV